MMRKIVIAGVAVASAAAGLVSGRAGGVPVASVRAEAASSAACATVPSFARGVAPGLASGDAMWAVAGGRLTSISAGRSVRPPEVSAGDVVKHVASSAGEGTAYVIDHVGADDVVVVTSRGTRRLRERTEVSHPAWSPNGDLAWATGSGVAVLDAETDRIRRMRSPIAGATVFSPVFLSGARLAAVVSAPPNDRVPEGERLANLWATRVGDDHWHRVTGFEAGRDRWATVRTPIVHHGIVYFVKVTGRGSAAGTPRFELWRLDRGRARLVARLPEERYLAGSIGSRLVWNVPDPATGAQSLAVEDADGRLGTIGCGAVMVEPVDAVDPDRLANGAGRVPQRGHWPELEAASHDDGAEEIAVIVGDFETAEQAATVAVTIRAAYPGSQVDVVDSSVAPLAIRPGVFGAMLHLAADADATEAIAEFRASLPEFGSNSWIVTP